MIFKTLHQSAQRGELMLVDGGICHWHLRKDGQLTIREIIATKPGAGSLMLNRLRWTPGATSIFAKCPAGLLAVEWYERKGFVREGVETTRSGRELVCFRLPLEPRLQVNAGEVELVYCADGNKAMMEIALDAGWLPGHQIPRKAYYRPHMVDLDPNTPPPLDVYVQHVQQHRPHMATVRDWHHGVTFAEVMAWAEALAPHVNELIIIPKVPGTVQMVPEIVCGKPVRLGYSVPTGHGSTPVQVGEFGSRRVHLLGGSPPRQLNLAQTMNVVSADTNYHQKLAFNCQFWNPSATYARNKGFPNLKESDGGWAGRDAHHEAFRRSCLKIIQAWRERESGYQQQPYTLTLFEHVN